MPPNELKTASLFPLLSASHSPNFASQSHYEFLKTMVVQNHEKFISLAVYNILFYKRNSKR